MSRSRFVAFTLVELLVVIGIIALLVSILLPTLGAARDSATMIKNLSNLRQLGIGLEFYKNDNRGFYPVHSSLSSVVPRMRWADYLYPYMNTTQVYESPGLSDGEKARMNKPFAHTINPSTGAVIAGVTIFFGGYGYNFHYLGNARQPGGIPPFHANTSKITAPTQTIAIADTHGSMNGGVTWTSEGVYTVDPPLMSIELGSHGSRRSSPAPGPGQYGYTGGNDGDPNHRSTPAERYRGKVGIVFCDGHAEPMTLQQMDDSNGDGVKDNGLWNGKGDANLR